MLAADFGSCPSSAAMARFSRSLSRFNSDTIAPVSKVLSFGRCSYKILSPLALIPQTKGRTSSHEPSDFANSVAELCLRRQIRREQTALGTSGYFISQVQRVSLKSGRERCPVG